MELVQEMFLSFLFFVILFCKGGVVKQEILLKYSLIGFTYNGCEKKTAVNHPWHQITKFLLGALKTTTLRELMYHTFGKGKS